MRVAVTGGSGVVGQAVVRHLVDSGHEVRALARSEQAMGALGRSGASPVFGDVLDADSVDALVSGCELVFHIAGVNELCSPNPARMWMVNVLGAEVVLAASARAGARRLVHTSSATTIGEREGIVATESTPRGRGFLSEYERSKTAAENLVMAKAEGIEVVSVNPASVQGPGRATGTGALLLAAARRRLPFLVDTTFSVVDIDDCARGHLLAAERAMPGQRYLLSGSILTVTEAVRILTAVTGTRISPWFLRPGLIRAAAPVAAALWGALGRRSLLCPESARVMLHGHRYDGSRATRDLGLEYTPIEETFARVWKWYRAEGLV